MLGVKETYGLQCFEIDLERSWFPLNETEYDATSDSFAFYSEEFDVRLYIYGERIDASGRDLDELASGLNAAALSGVQRSAQQLGGTLLVDEAVGLRDTETTSEVDVTAEIVGPAEVRQRMLVAAVVNSVVAIYLRLESRNLMSGDLRTLWQNLRPNLFLAEPAPPDSAP